jgi:hypothetical protein
MSEVRVTKSMRFAEVRDLMVEAGRQDLADFAQAEIDSIAAKAAKAKERNAKNKAEADEFEAIVAGALTDELQTGAELYEAVGFDAEDEKDSLTLGKIRARLAKLVASGAAVKDDMKVKTGDKTRTVKAYRLA